LLRCEEVVCEFLGLDKMGDNVFALVKKKGAQKKPRGKAAQVAKRRAAAAEAAGPQRVPDKQNPFRPFKNFEQEEMVEQIDQFVQRAGWTQDRQVPDHNLDRSMVKMFNLLKTGIPFPFVKTFFVDFDESDSYNIIRYFDEFRERPNVRIRIENMKEIIRQRKAQPLNIPKDVLVTGGVIPESAGRKYEGIKFVEKEGGKLRERAVSPTERPKTMFGPDEILSQCEREYRRAPWMFPFSDQVIRGFALKTVDPEFTIPQEIKDDWFKVNMKWYRMACKGERVFRQDAVAYVTINNDLIVETRDMFDASLKEWIREFTPLDINGYDVAKRMIMSNEILKTTLSDSELDRFATAVLASFGPIQTNYDLARKTSYVLVFLTKLLDEPQSYHERIKMRGYTPDVLINLDRYLLLPEIFRNPNVEKTPFENKIKRARRVIENRYYEFIKQADPAVRRHTRPRRVEAPMRGGTAAGVAGPQIALPALLPTSVSEVRERRSNKELAPGLFQKLRERIGQLTPIYCNKCDAEVFVPAYTTPRGTQRLKFCSKECFDRYDI